jgi:hypothetical protein
MPRLEIAVEYRDGRKETVRVGRPADLIAFADEFEKVAPDPSGPNLMREAAWLVHRSLRVDTPFETWVEELDDLEMVRAAKVAPAGEPEAELELEHEEPAPAPDPTWPGEGVTQVLEAPDWPFERPHRRIETRTGSSSPA